MPIPECWSPGLVGLAHGCIISSRSGYSLWLELDVRMTEQISAPTSLECSLMVTPGAGVLGCGPGHFHSAEWGSGPAVSCTVWMTVGAINWWQYVQCRYLSTTFSFLVLTAFCVDLQWVFPSAGHNLARDITFSTSTSSVTKSSLVSTERCVVYAYKTAHWFFFFFFF